MTLRDAVATFQLWFVCKKDVQRTVSATSVSGRRLEQEMLLHTDTCCHYIGPSSSLQQSSAVIG